jgi:hypothetical protein
MSEVRETIEANQMTRVTYTDFEPNILAFCCEH